MRGILGRFHEYFSPNGNVPSTNSGEDIELVTVEGDISTSNDGTPNDGQQQGSTEVYASTTESLPTTTHCLESKRNKAILAIVAATGLTVCAAVIIWGAITAIHAKQDELDGSGINATDFTAGNNTNIGNQTLNAQFYSWLNLIRNGSSNCLPKIQEECNDGVYGCMTLVKNCVGYFANKARDTIGCLVADNHLSKSKCSTVLKSSHLVCCNVLGKLCG